jgi:hypothetical protein
MIPCPIQSNSLLSHVGDDNGHGLIACSSAINNYLSPLDIFTEIFDPKEQVIVGLNSLCSRHLFSDISDFVSDLTPIAPFEIHGVGGTVRVSKGNVRLQHCDSNGNIKDKISRCILCSQNSSPPISIPQWARDTDDCSSLSTGGFLSVFVWDGDLTTVSRTSQSGVPFLQADVGHPTHQSLYSICNLAHKCVAINNDTNLCALMATTFLLTLSFGFLQWKASEHKCYTGS